MRFFLEIKASHQLVTSSNLSHHFGTEVPDFIESSKTCFTFHNQGSKLSLFVIETNCPFPTSCNYLGISRISRNAAFRGHRHFTRGDHGRLVDGD